ncbi:unnamed protein product [Jaminaea pallidilutea]
MSSSELQTACAAFEQTNGFYPATGKRLSPAWVEQAVCDGLTDFDRFRGARFDRIVAKVGLLRRYLRMRALSTPRRSLETPPREIWCLLEATDDDAAIARYFLARTPCPELLDVANMAEVQHLASQRPWLDARRADVVLDYKIFTVTQRGTSRQEGSYSGLAAASTGATRMAQHMEAFAEAVSDAKDLRKDIMNQRTLYDPRTVLAESVYLVASNFHLDGEDLMDVWGATTGTHWPLAVDAIHRLTASMDEMLLCVEFEDWDKALPGIRELEKTGQHLSRAFRAMNSVFPAGISSDRALSMARIVNAAAVEDRQDARRLRLGWQLEHEGLKASHEKDVLVVKIEGQTFKIAWNSTEELGPARLRLRWTGPPVASISGVLAAANPRISQLLDLYGITVIFASGEETTAGFMGARLVDDEDEDDDGWRPVLELMHWAATRYRRLAKPEVAAQPAVDSLLGGIAQRLVSRTGCGLEVMRDDAGSWKVEMPLWQEGAGLLDHYALTQREEETVGQFWTLPASLQPPQPMQTAYDHEGEGDQGDQWKLFLLLRAEGKHNLVYCWYHPEQGLAPNQQTMRWRKLDVPVDPCHRVLLNLVREFLGLEFRMKPQKGNAARYSKHKERSIKHGKFSGP